jgi:hypothetical protein
MYSSLNFHLTVWKHRDGNLKKRECAQNNFFLNWKQQKQCEQIAPNVVTKHGHAQKTANFIYL